MKSLLVIFTVLLLIVLAANLPGILRAWASSSCKTKIAPAAATSCVDRYNDLLKRGKAALVAGDRAASVDALLRAEQMLASCPALQDESTSQARALVLDVFTRGTEVNLEQRNGSDAIGCREIV